MSMPLYSHPHLELREHIEQVEQGLDALQQWHSKPVRDSVAGWLPKLARFHDLGKASAAFQTYIQDPLHFEGDPREKAHTPLSLLLTLCLSEAERWEALEALALAAVVRGHHGSLPTFPERKIGAVSCSDHDLDNFAGGETARVLKKLLLTLNVPELEKETGLPLTELDWGSIRQEPGRFVQRMRRYLDDALIAALQKLGEGEAVLFRLKTQLLFSLLLEADKALLAVAEPKNYLKREARRWEPQWVERCLGKPQDTLTNRLRRRMREEAVGTMEHHSGDRIFSLTAPTGCGKTLLAATWALSMQEQARKMGENPPKIIVVLPLLSVIDQTVKEYAKLLSAGGIERDGHWLLTSHSLADRRYAEGLEAGEERFFVDTWRSELIITTYDQFLMSLLEPKARYQMRFHHLCDALIVMDEVQSLPCQLWQPLDRVLKGLVSLGSTKLLLMSATLPAFVSGQTPLVTDYASYFSAFSRYELQLHLEEVLSLDVFCDQMQEELPGWLGEGKRVLITLNTRASARKVWQALCEGWGEAEEETPLFFISADVTPKDRLATVERIKEGKPCIVVSTQSIEAGVDIDMDMVIRDFAPLDSLIQVAGRCNREGLKPRGVVRVVDIVNENDKRYSSMIYDPVHLQVTRELLLGLETVVEEDVLPYTEHYFLELSKRKNSGGEHLQRFLCWQEGVPVRELLRGKEKAQFTFLVLEQDPSLQGEMDAARRVADRWERREAWRALASRIAMISINVLARPGFHPRQIADEYVNDLWLLRSGYYSRRCGLTVEGETRIF
ncbi:Helicase Cas3, CRISPR-associated, core [Acididesulfobacillus acetoxydans]|uniref:CRISPR-associated HD domain protein n=1 Tax=Acididesulfobacillus acetoxydans TaxID=1561005 RepID=A0A8S0WQS3_9FIRM|nr:CRISPR-associated helicase Cas3' [Acididesulfobacillus acetoxydans]CAA7602824.1 Helicase Cas3, CRISPR-associated, core [Acididesulfobacillus acetoxydans]CEJ05705.1 CRISPR-associated HD domain protein [Acididesulfobacillus acetoxydans]